MRDKSQHCGAALGKVGQSCVGQRIQSARECIFLKLPIPDFSFTLGKQGTEFLEFIRRVT